jgi:hypothetical protein
LLRETALKFRRLSLGFSLFTNLVVLCSLPVDRQGLTLIASLTIFLTLGLRGIVKNRLFEDSFEAGE